MNDNSKSIAMFRKERNKLLWLLIAFTFQTISLGAQTVSKGKSILSVYAGPSHYMGKLIGITDNSDEYRDNLRNGFTWSASYYYVANASSSNPLKFLPGIIYQGTRYKHSAAESSDKIMMNYIAPQLGLCYFKPHYILSLAGGIGYQFYSDKSTVYGKPRDVSMDKVAWNLAASGEYLFTAKWGVSAKVNWIVTSSDSYSVKYNWKKWQVEDPRLSGGGGSLSQLSLLIGLNYHF